jgi:SNF2 family DNA or RNA helicase
VKYKAHIYQDHATRHIIENRGAGLFLEMGLGKTVATLTAIDLLINQYFDISRVLVVAPKKVAEDVWTSEADKWDHLRHLKISQVLGSERKRKEALKAKADIYVINRENLVWLVGHYGGAFPFDMLVVDELSSFKSPSSARFKALRMVLPKIGRVVGLTGTPAPNGLMDLWSQVYLLDSGVRLGKTITEYRTKFFTKLPYTPFGKYEIRQNKDSDADLIGEDYYQKKIYGKISDICISMKAEDWLELPKLITTDIPIHLPADIKAKYGDFERQQVLKLASEEKITALNRGVLTGKLLQFANGAVYDENKDFHEIHNLKLEALAEDLEAAAGNPFLLFYSYQSDLARIKKHLKEFKPVELKSPDDIARWNRKEIPFLLAHPQSAGHGLNMQYGGDYMGWFGLTWSLELYLQAIARILRQGRKNNVLMRRYLAKGTMDYDVAYALDNKEKTQELLLQAVKARIDKYTLKKAS